MTFMTEKPKSTKQSNELIICIDPRPLIGARPGVPSGNVAALLIMTDPQPMKKKNPKNEKIVSYEKRKKTGHDKIQESLNLLDKLY